MRAPAVRARGVGTVSILQYQGVAARVSAERRTVYFWVRVSSVFGTERYRSGRNGGASKASCRVSGTWVRIPPSPPTINNCKKPIYTRKNSRVSLTCPSCTRLVDHLDGLALTT